jgi:spore maturation protein CgeB
MKPTSQANGSGPAPGNPPATASANGHGAGGACAESTATPRLKIVMLGLSITSSWGNGHATTYRALVRQLGARGHDVLFLERDLPWYAENRDRPSPEGCRTELYMSTAALQERFEDDVQSADLVVVGSYVPDGIEVGEWVTRTARGVTAFYDIDTPVTLAKLSNGGADYLTRDLIPKYDLYLSFTGGPTLDRLEAEFGAPLARALYCSVDVDEYAPEPAGVAWDMGYLGTYSDDRQPRLTRLLVEPARGLRQCRFVVAGAQYPSTIEWPRNVARITHLPPCEHRAFYNTQRYTLNITRADMIRAGWSPSVRLFEAAACGTPIISDWWDGLDQFFEPGSEILIARDAGDIATYLHDVPEEERIAVGARARERILERHTSAHRASELESFMLEARQRS